MYRIIVVNIQAIKSMATGKKKKKERAKSWPIDDLFGVFKSFETFKKKKNLRFSLKDLEKSPPGD